MDERAKVVQAIREQIKAGRYAASDKLLAMVTEKILEERRGGRRDPRAGEGGCRGPGGR